MAQTALKLKIVSDILKNGRVVRQIHGTNRKNNKSLHNAETIATADSMGRTRGKLSGAEWEKNGMTKVGPSQEALQSLSSEQSTAIPKMEASNGGMLMTDPNSSMWHLCKGNQVESKAKKIAMKFKKMKDNIKNYYLERLEENQLMFNDVQQPLKLAKEEKKPVENLVRLNEEEMEALEEMRRPQMMKKSQKLSLLNQLQKSRPIYLDNHEGGELKNNDMEEVLNSAQAKPNVLQESQQVYKKFTKVKSRSKFVESESDANKLKAEGLPQENMIRRNRLSSKDAEARSGRNNHMMGKDPLADMEERGKNEKLYVGQPEHTREGTLLQSLWKKSISGKSDREAREKRGEGCSDIVGEMPQTVHFKTLPRASIERRTGLLDAIKSDSMIMKVYRQRIANSRCFSTLRRGTSIYPLKKPRNAGNFVTYDKFKPLTLVLQRQIDTQCENARNLGNSNLIRSHSLSTCTTFHAEDDPCKPQALPPKDLECNMGEKLPKCPKPEIPPWPSCPKITLCGCDPPHPRLQKLNCGFGDLTPFISLAKRPEYKCPSFSECSLQTELNRKRLSECCIRRKACDNFVGPKKPFVSALERQEINLGQKYWTDQNRTYHTTNSRFNDKPSEEECSKPGKGQLPCLKASSIPGQRKKEPEGIKLKGSCEKLCMPCCEPATDPPECFANYQKQPCNKLKNPRPSFSECRKRFPFRHTMCECEVPKKPKCEEKKKGSEPSETPC